MFLRPYPDLAVTRRRVQCLWIHLEIVGALHLTVRRVAADSAAEHEPKECDPVHAQ